MSTEEIFAGRLQLAMKAKGVGVYDMADATGLCFTTIYAWLRGERIPNGILLPVICRTLDASADWLLGLRGTDRRVERMAAGRERIAAPPAAPRNDSEGAAS